MSLPYRVIVGLEVHLELSTQTKMFCRCVNDPFHAPAPNTHVCPTCFGLPGALPVPNEEAIRKAILMGKALGATIAEVTRWDRKHYFYPDLPKGYQISQYYAPLCTGGELRLPGEEQRVIGFVQAHLEEDAGKLMHGAKKGYSKVDLNRAGVPLLEMVTKPDIASAAEARRVLQELQLLARTLGVSDADMEKGQMRADVNINIAFTHQGRETRTPITEVKNVNSSRAVERAILTEAQRQFDEWQAGGPITKRTGKITVGWDEDANAVNLQRAKEGQADYRYLPEPDLPPLTVRAIAALNPDTFELPELPNAIRSEYLGKGLVPADVELLFADGQRLLLAVRALEAGGVAAKEAAKWLIHVPGSEGLSASELQGLIAATERGDVSFSSLKPFVPELVTHLAGGGSLGAFFAEKGLLQAHDDRMVQSVVADVLRANPQAVADFQAGNERILGFFVGQVMKQCGGKAQPAKVQETVRAALNK